MWNHNLSEAPRDGSHVLMATTDGKRYLTRWLAPTKFTPSGRFDGFSENAKTLLAWASVPEHPNSQSLERVSPQAEEATTGSADANVGGGHVTDGESAQPVRAGEPSNSSPAFFLEDCGSGA